MGSPKSLALKARFTSGRVPFIIGDVPQSLSKVILHIIFSSKNREPWLDSNVRPQMHAYLSTICRDVGGEIVHVGCVEDHVHITTTLPRTLSQAQLVEKIKKASSNWIKALDTRYRGFFWQRGYGAFSVSASQLDSVLEYANKQQEHHRRRTFQDEYRELHASMAWISTNATFGIRTLDESRLQRLCNPGNQIPGAMPQAEYDLAPWR